jgi:hypothetical protein
LSAYFHLRAEHRRLTGELRAREDELGKLDVTAKTSLARWGELESALHQITTSLVAATRRSETLAETLGRVASHCPVTGHARRAGDTASRYGETRFGILLPGANTATARRIAEDVRRAIEAHWIAHPIPGASPTVTVHVGVATLIPSPISRPEPTLRALGTGYPSGSWLHIAGGRTLSLLDRRVRTDRLLSP